MAFRYQEVWLNDVALSAVHPAVLIQHIQENPPRMTQKTAARNGSGQWLTSNRIESREIVVSFAIREGIDFMKRAAACSAVAEWAVNGGKLILSDRPGQQIHVACTAVPAVGKLREWTNELTVTFTAYDWPYWMEQIPSTVSGTNMTSGTLTLPVTGTVPAVLEAEITPASAALTSLTLTGDNGDSIALTSLNVAAESTLKLWYDDLHLLHITNGTTALLNKRTAASADDIRLKPGLRTITVAASTASTVKLMARGVYV